MKTKISILGSGSTGIQVAVYLLEQYVGEILLYDDDVEYAKGMALDCMQASAVRGWQGSISAVDSIEALQAGDVLVVTEGVNRLLSEQWISAVRNAKCAIYASCFEGGISQAFSEGVSEESLIGLQGIIDSRVLAEVVSGELNIAVEDVQAMVYGGVGKKMNSKPDFVRVNGIPINLISEGLFDTVLATARSKDAYENETWPPYYTMAAAAVEVVLIMESGMHTILPITGKNGTMPALIGNYGIQKFYEGVL